MQLCVCKYDIFCIANMWAHKEMCMCGGGALYFIIQASSIFPNAISSMWKEQAGCSSFYRLLSCCSIKASCRLLSYSLLDFSFFFFFFSGLSLILLSLTMRTNTHTSMHTPDSRRTLHIRLLCLIKVHRMFLECFYVTLPNIHSFFRNAGPLSSSALYLCKINSSQGDF